MKLRVRHNSIRLRLTKGEVARLAEGQSVQEEIVFGQGKDARLVYILTASTDVSGMAASIDGGSITIQLPKATTEAWAATDQVGIEAEQDVGGGKVLSLLVEKDFACLQPRGAEDADTFDHPMKCG